MNRDELLVKLAGCSSEDKQLYASSCLRRYCELMGISHPAISELLDHLDSIASGKSLAEWDAKGALLDLNGRGDPIPVSLRSMMSGDDLIEFENLVDSVVEVGIVDLYGAKTNLPLKFLDKAMLVLERRGLPLPELNG
ncbi:hypothetical protein DF107_35275 [Burkholderia stagnalis]|uniref:hypothetical protein n=1 Tax=Burkholderia stagnalis TaxID=1503054 RepID=UPI000F5890E3|nr:hypothetical protein [Burkholderia stagnalis]RQQ02771.1 hypothetical protein DF164_24955 [Burkholderia stagnalis]RQQ04364.1 hypothetical protein DF161_35380 [Burkholderia stagnalis]RQQ26749.1 hypothetical protein DF163_20260 [Burkholderia stagnalis]RQQ29202.1 hypothetical protein DF148_24265 [Burkholderia stagnalis]RQQ29946.1 hypothetical protein DF149_18645 [Burkholderia stagnalis]